MKKQLEQIIEKHYDPDTEVLESGAIAEEIETFFFEFVDYLKANCKTVDATHSEKKGYFWTNSINAKEDPILYSSREIYNWYKSLKSISMIPVESSQIKSIGYSGSTLYIEFLKGTVYSYTNVPDDVHTLLLLSKSVGKYFASEIKGKYEFVKTDRKVEGGELK